MLTVAAQYGYLGAQGDTQTWGADFFIDHPLQLLNLLELS